MRVLVLRFMLTRAAPHIFEDCASDATGICSFPPHSNRLWYARKSKRLLPSGGIVQTRIGAAAINFPQRENRRDWHIASLRCVAKIRRYGAHSGHAGYYCNLLRKSNFLASSLGDRACCWL
jgi:hypothetical protein